MSSNLYTALSCIISNQSGLVSAISNIKYRASVLDNLIITPDEAESSGPLLFLSNRGQYQAPVGVDLSDYVLSSQLEEEYVKLDAGKIPARFLPSYVDDVIEGYYSEINKRFYKNPSLTGDPISNETGKLYIDITSGKNGVYRYTGSTYFQITRCQCRDGDRNTY